MRDLREMWKGGLLVVVALLGLVLLGSGCARHKVPLTADSKGPAPKPAHLPQPSPALKSLTFGAAPPPIARASMIMPPAYPAEGRDSYKAAEENGFLRPLDAPLSTFGVDVDTASYANVRRYLEAGDLPPADAVRVEEMINYFSYAYPRPADGRPFAVSVAVHPCPWKPEHLLARVALAAREADLSQRPPANLVFLIDVSGSMMDEDKLPLLKRGMKLLAENLKPEDTVGIVTYAGAAGVALEAAPGSEKTRITSAIDALNACGSTNGEGGIRLAYDMARRHLMKDGINRVLLATDGDFNVGVTGNDELERIIAEEAKSGVFLTVLGFGRGNLQDDKLEALADRGNGQYAYVDSFNEARRVLLEQASGTLLTVAKDVKIQVEFNPARVGAYRLVGYENRLLAAEDFNDDRKDAGEVGAGHTVTALYEIAPPGADAARPKVDPLKYGETPPEQALPDAARQSDELMTIKLRHKAPDAAESVRAEDIPVAGAVSDAPDGDFQFAAAVAAFGMILGQSDFAGNADMELVARLARAGRGDDPDGARSEFISLAENARALLPAKAPKGE